MRGLIYNRRAPRTWPVNKYERYFNSCGVEPVKVPYLRNFILKNRPTTHNTHMFEPITENDIIIIVQVSKNISDLDRLIKSFRRLVSIDRTLLIFSHLYVDSNKTELIKNINFATVAQIYFPFGEQTCKDYFPGESLYYCETSVSCENMVSGQRNASLAQMKHFFWWTMHFIFDVYPLTKNAINLMLSMEDSDLVTPDFMHVVQLLDQYAYKHCPYCALLSLSNRWYKKSDTQEIHSAKISEYVAERFYTGLVFSKLMWNGLRKYGKAFCAYNDYDWRRSLQYVSSIATPRKLMVFHLERPRVMAAPDYLRAWGGSLKNKSSLMHPTELTINTDVEETPFNEPGGLWTDIRDKRLCLIMRNMTTIYTSFLDTVDSVIVRLP